MLENKHISQSTRQSQYSSYTHSSLLPDNITKLSSLSPSSMPSAADQHSVLQVERRVLDPFFMPLMAESLDDVTDAYIVTAHHDVLRDDGLCYASRLRSSTNVRVRLQHYRDAFHAFFHFSQGPLRLQVAERAVNDLIEYIDSQVIRD